MEADLVSLKLDAIREDLWRMINRPHKDLRLKAVLEGIERFSEEFKGAIISETMLIDGIDYGDEFKEIVEFLGNLKRLDKAYIAIPTRLPAEEWVRPAKEETINPAFQAFSEKLGAGRVE
jgi:wyosine [tRNA(Phe)-imidazoG37] synthetase (radical SAM superfamily)